MISFACAFAVILLFFLNTYEWLLPTITVIFPLFWPFFEKKKKNALNINLVLMTKILANLRQLVNIIRRNTMIAILGEI